MSDSDSPGDREVAFRPFAAEYDDATLSYSESDEERAPNYVVTPTGLRANRVFAVGVLTEVERVNDDVLRARIVDPTGAFVTYAGQYQPEAAAFLDRTEPPAFVSLTGKARTFQPDDSDVVYTSVRPESVNAVDADTRDRWVVSAAESTLDRVAIFADALAMDARGEDLREALLAAGVEESLAAGVSRAIDHYGTTPTYLEAVRTMAVDALELVAGERDDVRPLDVAPGEGGDADLGSLPAGIESPAGSESAAVADASATAAPDADASSAGDPSSTTDSSTAKASTAAQSPSADSSTAGEEVPDDAGAESATPEAAQSAAAGGDGATATDDPTAGAADDSPEGAGGGTDDVPDDESAIGDSATDAPTSASTSDASTDAGEDLGDFDAGGSGADDGSDAVESADLDEDMYEFDEDERREIEEEFGTEFTSGSEVDAPGEADIDVAGGDGTTTESSATDQSDGGSEGAGATESARAASTGSTDESADAEPESADARGDEPTEDPADGADDTPAPEDVDVESAAVRTMDDLDDGDGAEREAVVETVVEEYGVGPGAVEDAIESALMSGRCYEPREDRLKAI